MKLAEAIECANKGQRIAFSEWEGSCYAEIPEGSRILHFSTGVKLPLRYDYFYGDWRIWHPPCITFDKALIALKEGKSIKRSSWPCNHHIRLFGKGKPYEKILVLYSSEIGLEVPESPNLVNTEDLLADDWVICE